MITRDFTAKTTITGRPEKSKDMKYLDAADASELTKALEADISVEHATKFMALVASKLVLDFPKLLA